MFCRNCGKKSVGSEKFCTSCGNPLTSSEKKEAPIPTYKYVKRRNWSNVVRIIAGIIIIGVIAWGVYSSSQNDTAVQVSNNAASLANSSDTDSATEQSIEQFKTAFANATDNDTKRTILINLAITYSSSNDKQNALNTYQQALSYASSGTSDYYLISGEIARFQNDPATTERDFLEADRLLPNDFQINDALALFYLDKDNSWVSYDSMPKALQYMKVAYAAEKNDITTENLAIIYYYNDDYENAINLLLTLNLNNHPAAALYLGYAYAKEKDVKNAEFYFQKAIDLGVRVPQEVNDYLNSN